MTELPEGQRRQRQRQQEHTESVHLGVMPVMEQVENTQSEGLSAGRVEEHESFHVPKTKQVSHIPSRAEARGDLRPMNVPKQEPSGRPAQVRRIGQIMIHGLKREGRTLPRGSEVTHRPGDYNHGKAVINHLEHRAIKNKNDADAQQNSWNQK